MVLTGVGSKLDDHCIQPKAPMEIFEILFHCPGSRKRGRRGKSEQLHFEVQLSRQAQHLDLVVVFGML